MARAISDVNTLSNVPVDDMLATSDVERERLPGQTELSLRQKLRLLDLPVPSIAA